MADMPAPDLDLVRFGYTVAARLEALDLSFAQVGRLTGLSKRQISFAQNGKPISAGATHVLAAALDIDLDAMLPVATAERLLAIRRMRAEEEANRKAFAHQAVTPPVSRETSREAPSEKPGGQA